MQAAEAVSLEADAVKASPVPRAATARPTISIVLPTYGRPMKVERFMRYHRDVFASSKHTLEFVVHDDCTPDETPEIIADWMKIDDRIRYVRHDKNKGFRPNFLGAMRAARGKYAIYAGNDDLLIPEIVEKYIDKMEADRSIGVIHAPWFLLDETKNNKIFGTSWPLETEMRFGKGQHGECMDYMLSAHVFPEWFIVRTDLIPEILATHGPQAYHFFAHLAHALMRTDVLFAPEPFAIVTAMSRGDVQVGNRETLEGWDEYRGGLEYFASFFTRDAHATPDGVPSLARRIQDFTNVRMGVALRLHLMHRNWLTAWHLHRRLLAYGIVGLDDNAAAEAMTLAAMESVMIEYQRANIKTVIATEKVFAMMREVINMPEGMRLVCDTDADADTIMAGEVCGVAHFGSPPTSIVAARHYVLDVAAVIRRFEAP
ncbi:MAG: glycosyltransferase family 2 protein [Burkholderiales bacterium]|nr:glycosyltransferase family 2 protein [Burkholderiales bacterium]